MSDYKISAMSTKEHIQNKTMWIGEKNDITPIGRENVDNSVDEVVNGHANKISFSINGPIIRIIDNGRGLPKHSIDVPMPDKSIVQMDSVIASFTQLFTSGKHDDTHYKHSKGVNGVGLVITNALSKWLICKIKDNQDPTKFYEYKFINFDEHIEMKTKKSSIPLQYSTWIEYELDDTKFKSLSFDESYFNKRFEYIAAKYNNVELYFQDKLIQKISLKEYFKKHLGINNEQIHIITYSDLSMTINLIISFSSSNRYIDKLAVCNTDFVKGSFLSTIDNVIFRAIKDGFNYNDISKKDALEGMRLFFDIVMTKKPSYVGQTKNEIEDNITGKISAIYSELVKKIKTNKLLKERIDFLIDISKKTEVIAKERKKKLELDEHLIRHKPSINLPGKILYLAEGKSASGSLGKCIDSKIEGYVEMGGKIPNVLKMSTTKLVNSTKLMSLFSSIGFSFEKFYNNESQDYNYHTYAILTDADDDGLHIASLVAFVFWKFMPDLIDQHRVKIILAPLYGGKNSSGEYIGIYNKHDLVNYKNVERFKGLGEMSPVKLDQCLRTNTYHILLKRDISNDSLHSILDIESKRKICYSGLFNYETLIEKLSKNK